MTPPPGAHIINEIVVPAVPFALSMLLIGLRVVLLVCIALSERSAMRNIATHPDGAATAVSSAASDKPATRSGRRSPLLVGLVLIAVTFAGYLGWERFAHSPGAAPQPASPVPIIATTVKKQNFPIVLTGIGYVTAMNSATIRSMITEPIISIDFKDGQYVKKGQLLAQLDPSTYQAQLDQAEANLARDGAHLENGRINLGRYIPLQKQGFAPQQQVATQQAKILQEEAVINADQAAIEYAKTQLSYTKLVAPFDGVAGIRLLDVGNIIHSSTTRGSPSEPNALVVINQVQPISVMFTLGATAIPEVQAALAKGPVEAIALMRTARRRSKPARSLRLTTKRIPLPER